MLLGGPQNTIKSHLVFNALFCFAPFSVFSSRMSAPYCQFLPGCPHHALDKCYSRVWYKRDHRQTCCVWQEHQATKICQLLLHSSAEFALIVPSSVLQYVYTRQLKRKKCSKFLDIGSSPSVLPDDTRFLA
jgi:hypothetical protein